MTRSPVPFPSGDLRQQQQRYHASRVISASYSVRGIMVHHDVHTTETVYDGKHIKLVRRNSWEFVTRKHLRGIVGIVAVNDQGRMLLVEQWRPPLMRHVIELPAGLAGDVAGHEGEDLETAARRELLEETGYEAETMEELADGTVSAGITDEIITLFRATGLRKVGD